MRCPPGLGFWPNRSPKQESPRTEKSLMCQKVNLPIIPAPVNIIRGKIVSSRPLITEKSSVRIRKGDPSTQGTVEKSRDRRGQSGVSTTEKDGRKPTLMPLK